MLQQLYELPVNGYFSVFLKSQTVFKYSEQRDESVFQFEQSALQIFMLGELHPR